jgi:predicted NBD/HSP70 family sugar kinase
VRDRIAGLGLSVPGLIDAEQRYLAYSRQTSPAGATFPSPEVFEDEFAIPCWVENDARAMAIGEAMFGAGRGHDNILCINVGRGIGAGIIMNGEIHRGKQGRRRRAGAHDHRPQRASLPVRQPRLP